MFINMELFYIFIKRYKVVFLKICKIVLIQIKMFKDILIDERKLNILYVLFNFWEKIDKRKLFLCVCLYVYVYV